MQILSYGKSLKSFCVYHFRRVIWKRFVDDKLSTDFGEDKIKSILLASKWKAKNNCQLNIKYKDINIKAACLSNISWMCARQDKVINNSNGKVKLIYGKNWFLSSELRRIPGTPILLKKWKRKYKVNA